MKKITLKLTAGTHLDQAILDACRMARIQKAIVSGFFNDFLLTASPNKSPLTIHWEWDIHCSRSSSKYRRSDGYKQELQRVFEMQRGLDAVMSLICVNPPEKNISKLLPLLCELAKNGDDRRVSWENALGLTSGGKELVAVHLEAAGFIQNEFAGNKGEFFDTSEKVGRYLIGQAIDCLRHGYAPHGVIVRLSEKYFNLLMDESEKKNEA